MNAFLIHLVSRGTQQLMLNDKAHNTVGIDFRFVLHVHYHFSGTECFHYVYIFRLCH